MTRAYLGLGSDRGDRARWLRRGMCELASAGLHLGVPSSIYLTEPVGDAALPWFLNCAVQIIQPPPPEELLELCLDVERRCGRLRVGGGLQSRSLDIDILLYDQQVIECPQLAIPHPRMHERRFVLAPLAEIAPTSRHPVLGSSVEEMLDALEPGERVWLMAPPVTGRG